MEQGTPLLGMMRIKVNDSEENYAKIHKVSDDSN